MNRLKIHNEQNTTKPRIKALLDEHDWFWWSPPSNGFGKAGVSDIHAVRPGVFMVIEAKYGSGKPTPAQVAFLNSIRAAGHFAFLVSERELDALATFLRCFNEAAEYALQGKTPPAEVGAPLLDAQILLTNFSA